MALTLPVKDPVNHHGPTRKKEKKKEARIDKQTETKITVCIPEKEKKKSEAGLTAGVIKKFKKIQKHSKG